MLTDKMLSALDCTKVILCCRMHIIPFQLMFKKII